MSLQGRRLRLSDVLSLMLNPSMLTGVFFCFLAVKFESPGYHRLVYASLSIVFTSLVPIGLLFVLKARGQLSDVEMSIRSERDRVYGLCAAGYGIGAVLLLIGGASWPLWGFLAWHVPNTLILIAFNRRLKVSIHTMVLTSLFIGILMFFGKPTAPLGLLILAAAWARWDADSHSPAELIWGVAIGGLLSSVEIRLLQIAFGG